MTTRSPALRRLGLGLGALLALAAGLARAGDGPHSLSLGARYHAEQTRFTDLPFDTGDLSYVLAYTFTDRWLGLQLALDAAPDVSGSRDAPQTNRTDFVLTPQANLILKDRFFRGGVGLLASYARDVEHDGDWIAPYWQIMLGLSCPLPGNLSLDGSVYYVLEHWDELAHFRGRDLEYGLYLNYAF